MKKIMVIMTVIFLTMILTGGKPMADKNIQMGQRNATNTEWDKHYPITKAENVLTASGTVASQLADIPNQIYITEKAKTVDVNNSLALKANQKDLVAANSKIAEHSSQIASLSSGAPKAATTVAQMTDTTKTYVYTGTEEGYTAGNWYYHSGTAWVSGGQYLYKQEVNALIGSNLWSRKNATEGYISATGVISPQTAKEMTSDYILIDISKNYMYSIWITLSEPVPQSWSAIGYYDSNKAFISRETFSESMHASGTQKYYAYPLTIPENAVYVRACSRFLQNGLAKLEIGTAGTLWSPCIDDLDKEIIPSKITQNPLNACVKSINHRGYSTAPENTLPAYRLSKDMGYSYVECDVRFTSDGVPVLLHDESINRTARNVDGTELISTTNIIDITYETALAYDFGIYKDPKYAGTKIPTLEEFILLCKKLNLHPYMELKFAITTSNVKTVVDIVKNLGMEHKVTWLWGIEELINLSPKGRMGVVAGSFTTSEIDTWIAQWKTTENEFFITAQCEYITQELSDYCIEKGIELEAWNVHTAEQVNTLAEMGVTGITNDNLNIAEILMQ